MPVSHLDLFFETRFESYVNPSDPTRSPNSSLQKIPEKAEIQYEDHPDKVVDCNADDIPFKVGRYLISRALLDPDAYVNPA